jgi:hypothetical protein
MIPPFLKRKNPLTKKFRFQTVVAPEVRRLCLNFTLSQPLPSPQISRLISSWLFAEESSSWRLWQMPTGRLWGDYEIHFTFILNGNDIR